MSDAQSVVNSNAIPARAYQGTERGFLNDSYYYLLDVDNRHI